MYKIKFLNLNLDMKTLDIELIDANCMEIIAKVQMFEIAQLTASNPIKGFFPAYDSAQVKVAEVYISIQFESLKGNLKKIAF